MFLKSKCEFRGSSERIGKDNKRYLYCNLEDENGESSKFQAVDDFDFSKFKKGDKVLANLEFNTKYGTLKLFDMEVVK